MNLIKDVVLIGTDRKPLDTEVLPERIRALISADASKEQKLLAAISYLHFYENHGNTSTLSIDNLSEPVDEIQEDTPDEVNVVLEEILKLDHLIKNSLLKEWLKMIDASTYKIPARFVLEILNTTSSFSVADRKRVHHNIGNRGRYLLELYPMAAFEFSESADQWTLGKIAERKVYFESLRKLDRSRAIDLLQQDWKELNLKEKIAFLTVIQDTLHPQDLDFLAKRYHEEFENTPAKKVGVKTLKLMLVGMLCQLDYSPILKQIKGELQQYVSVKGKGLLGGVLGGKTKKINLPQQTDEFWNGENLNSRYGFEQKNANPTLFDYDPIYWMSTMIAYFPFKLWCDLLEKDQKATMTYLLTYSSFLTKIKGEKISVFRSSLIAYGQNYKEQSFIENLMKIIEGNDVEALLPLMSQPNFEAYLLKHKRFDFHLLISRSENAEHQWSPQFSKKCVSELLKFCKTGTYKPSLKYGLMVAKYFHSEAFDHLIQVSNKYYNEPWFHSWRDNIVLVIQNTVTVRKELRELKGVLGGGGIRVDNGRSGPA